MMQDTSSPDDVDNRTTPVVKHDPQGLIRRDMLVLNQAFPRKPYDYRTSHAEVMYREGQQSVLDFIERKLIARK